MSCKEWKTEWVAWLYDELDGEELRAATLHLERCADCRATMDRLSYSQRVLKESAPAVPAAPRVVVLQPKRAWSPIWAFAAGAACAVVVFGLGFFAAPGGPSVPAPAIQQFENRLALLESGTTDNAPPLTEAQLRQSLDRLERRFNRARQTDLEYLMQSITASELRTGSWLDQTHTAMNLLAMRQDPRFSER